jgi:hypothetical protein
MNIINIPGLYPPFTTSMRKWELKKPHYGLYKTTGTLSLTETPSNVTSDVYA